MSEEREREQELDKFFCMLEYILVISLEFDINTEGKKISF